MEKYLEVRDISKAFPGVQALKDIELYAEGGKVTALLGENGAGKSTLLKILSGALKPDTGTVVISGKPVEFGNTHAALDAGISIIYQERQLMPMMSVAENIFLDDAPASKLGFLVLLISVSFTMIQKRCLINLAYLSVLMSLSVDCP